MTLLSTNTFYIRFALTKSPHSFIAQYQIPYQPSNALTIKKEDQPEIIWTGLKAQRSATCTLIQVADVSIHNGNVPVNVWYSWFGFGLILKTLSSEQKAVIGCPILPADLIGMPFGGSVSRSVGGGKAPKSFWLRLDWLVRRGQLTRWVCLRSTPARESKLRRTGATWVIHNDVSEGMGVAVKSDMWYAIM